MTAEAVANALRGELGQESFTIQAPDKTVWFSWRPADLALAAAANGGDVKQAPGEAPQSGPNEDSGNAQPLFREPHD